MKLFNVISFFIILLISIETEAQVSIAEFLSSAKADASVKVLDEQINYLQGKPYRLSYLNKLELRVQNNQIYGDNHRYGVRVTPSNPWEVISNNRYYKTFQETLVLEKEIAFKDALRERYDLAVEYLFLIELKALREKNKALLDAQLTMLEKQQYSDFFDIDDFVDLKLDQMSRAVELEDIAYEISTQINKIDLKYDVAYLKTLNWNSDSLIAVPIIEKVVDSLINAEIASSTLAYKEKKINLAQKEYTLERSNLGLGYIQTQYTDGRSRSESPWGISAGISIPITNPNKGDMAKRQLDVIEARNEKQSTEADLKVEISSEHDRLKTLIGRYHEMEKKISTMNVNSLGSTLSSLNSNNPIVIIKLNANLLKLQLIQLKMKQDIFNNYIELLALHDRLQQKPLVNYLSAGLRKIDEDGD
jgi:hypothetical protein